MQEMDSQVPGGERRGPAPRSFPGASRCARCQQAWTNQEWFEQSWRCPTPGCTGEEEDMQPVGDRHGRVTM